METISQAAIVLQSVPFRDADLIVSLLGKDTGRVTAMAKGARRSKKRFLGGINEFDCGTFDLERRRSSDKRYVLVDIRERKIFAKLRENFRAFTLSAFCLETTRCFAVEGDPEGRNWFGPLFLALRALDEAENDNKRFAIAAYFGLLTLKMSGYHVLDDSVRLDDEVRTWLDAMDDASAPIVPFEEQTTKDGFWSLVRYMESTLGHGLKTTAQCR